MDCLWGSALEVKRHLGSVSTVALALVKISADSIHCFWGIAIINLLQSVHVPDLVYSFTTDGDGEGESLRRWHSSL